MDAISIPEAGPQPKCIYCGAIRESFTGDPCPCPGATEARTDRATALEQEQERAKASTQREVTARAITPVVDSGLARLRMEAQREREAEARQAARDARWDEVKDREITVKEREIGQRESRQDGYDSEAADTPAEAGATLADFTHEVTLAESERLPSALVRSDGATLLYEGKFNTVYGEAAQGKTWLAIMAALDRLRAGRHVLWWDFEDKPITLATRLQDIRATNWIGAPALRFVSGPLPANPEVMAEALGWLAEGNGPGLVIIDSATSAGCPSDGADVAPWLAEYVNPWWYMGHTVLLLDHVPKQRKDRPRGGIGSNVKLQRPDGAALYASGQVWNKQQDGFIHLYVHKDRPGDLPAIMNQVAATITGVHDGQMIDYTIGLPNAKDDAEDLQDELLDALIAVGPDGVKGSRAMRDLLKGKGRQALDRARDDLLSAGLIERRKDGQSFVYTVVG